MRLAWLALLLAACKPAAPAPLRVAAASDLTRPFTELARLFEQQGGPHVELIFGSTGLLEKQLEEGAPYDLFAAADVAWADKAAASGACESATVKLYARGRLALWTRADVPLPASLEALQGVGRLAIANPEHAPYGRAARAALQKAGVWDALQPRIVYGENVQQTFQYAQSGNADAALIALALVVGRTDGHFLPIEGAAIDQALVLCVRGQNHDAAARLAALITGPQGREVLRRYGFLLPGQG